MSQYRYFDNVFKNAKFTNEKCQVCSTSKNCLEGEYFDQGSAVTSVCLDCLDKGLINVNIPQYLKERIYSHIQGNFVNRNDNNSPDKNGKYYLMSMLDGFAKGKVKDIDILWDDIAQYTAVFVFECLECSKRIAIYQSIDLLDLKLINTIISKRSNVLRDEVVMDKNAKDVSKEFVRSVFKSIVEDGIKIYRREYDKVNVNEIREKCWREFFILYKNLSNKEKEYVFSIFEHIITDTISCLFGIIDGSSTLIDSNLEPKLSLDGVDTEASLLDYFWEYVQDLEEQN